MALSRKGFLQGALALLSAALLVLLGIVVVAIALSSRTANLGTTLLQARKDRILTEDVLQTLLNLETGQRGYLISGDPQYLRPFETARRELPKQLKALEAVGVRRGLSSGQIALLTATAKSKVDELDETVGLAKSGHRDRAFALVQTNRGLALMDNARRLLDSLVAAAEQRVSTDDAAMIATSQRLRQVTEFGGAFIVLSALGAFFLAVRYTKELQQARAQVEELNAGLEARVAERTVSLSRANEEIQRFAYIVSHDLRAPLVNIMGFTSELDVAIGALRQYLAAKTPDEALASQAHTAVEEDLPEAARFIRSSRAKMDKLIKAILRLSREGGRTMTAERVDLASLVANAAAALKHQADVVGARIEVPARLPVVISDRLALEQVFGNLLDNALKYLCPDRPGRVVVTARDEGPRIVVSVSDNGRGIAEQDHERVFDLFRRAGVQDRPGEGIGLAHVLSLVRRLGGEVALRSRLGEGSEFRVELPKLILSQASQSA